MWCAGGVCVGSERALILNLLIKWACRVGVCPISACAGLSKQHILPADVRSPLSLNTKRRKINDSYFIVIHVFRKGLIPSHLDFSSFRWLFPMITDQASFHMFCRQRARNIKANDKNTSSHTGIGRLIILHCPYIIG